MIKTLVNKSKSIFLSTILIVLVFLFVTAENPVLKIQDMFTLFLSLIVEATPFVVLGVSVSILVSLFLEEDWILNLLPKNRFISHFLLSIIGIFLPVCECGNIPVARRLMLKGFNVSHAVTFLLAAPIVNPITFFSTREAFRIVNETTSWQVAFTRIIFAIIIANIIGLVLSTYKNQKNLLTKEFNVACDTESQHGAFSKKFIQSYKKKNKKEFLKTTKAAFKRSVEIFQDEFYSVMKMLIIGAFAAAIFQSFVPREIILSIGQNIFLSIIAMILLSFVISICATVDAFFAASFASSFTLGSLMSFMVFGPMIDIKILSMLSSTFKPKLLLVIIILITLLSILCGLIVNYFY